MVFHSRKNESMEAASICELSLRRIVRSEEVTNDIIVMKNIMRLTWKTFARSQAFKEVLNVINVSRRLASSRKQQDSLHAL